MNNIFYKKLFFWILVIVCFSSWIFFVSDYHRGVILAPSVVESQSIENGAGGYAFSIPKNWYVESSSSDRAVVYPDYDPVASSSATCKIEMTIFGYASSTDISDWISHRLGVDPTVDVHEESSEDISIGNTSGIKWIGTMNDIPTTLVYAFNKDHAYEIAPSGQCVDALDIFLQKLTL